MTIKIKQININYCWPFYKINEKNKQIIQKNIIIIYKCKIFIKSIINVLCNKIKQYIIISIILVK